MRGLVPDLDTAFPLLFQLPGVYQDGDFTPKFLQAFDDCLAPVLSTLDNLRSYVDPRLAPADFVAMLAYWVAVQVDDQMQVPDQRQAVVDAMRTHARRGTAAALRGVVAHLTGAEVEVSDSGAVTTSSTPGTPLPGAAVPEVHVRIVVDDPEGVDRARVESVLRTVKPVHVRHVLEVVAR
ncbi:MAG: phage tail protein [Intrasporangium sp.]|uniref:phage tail protein n=1 Tax=Intrasporangium sp. TaxID=1925024 RepID=UPI0026478700|nr:phage tail protein [Intrasporangium sp.]MDN5798371.1 phage tail protein [Intrasporangium sp.]